MSRRVRKILSLLGGLAVLLALLLYFRSAVERFIWPERQFNIVLITLDATRADHFSTYGYPGRLTPNMDRLAGSGVVFRRAYCYAGSTAPSMAALFSSQLPYWPEGAYTGGGWEPVDTYGLTRFFEDGKPRPGFPPTVRTLPMILKEHGYTTAGVSTNPFLTRDFNFDRGFDLFEESSPRMDSRYASAEDVGRKVKVYLEELKEKKFFIWAHFMDNHVPLLDYNPFREEARRRGFEPAHLHQPVSEWTPSARDYIEKFGSKAVPNWKPTETKLLNAFEEYRFGYAAQLVRVDNQVGEILKTLRELGLWENTLVVIVNDHGDEFMEHGDFGHTGQLYEEIVRGVWIMHNPKLIPRPVEVKEPVSLLDVVPTVVELLRFREDRFSFDGVSRVPRLRAKKNGEGGFVFGVLARRAYVIEGEYKLIVNNDFGKPYHGGAAINPPRAPLELYNLKEDPREQTNLATERPEVADRLFVRLQGVFLEKGIRVWAEKRPSDGIRKETVERLKALGYVR